MFLSAQSQDLFRTVEVLSAIVGRVPPSSTLKSGELHESVETQKLDFLMARAFHHIHIRTRSCRPLAVLRQYRGYLPRGKGEKRRAGKKHNLTLIVEHFSAVPASWTSMRQNSNTIFPLITYARISGAINWFWELSSIFNPSSGSVGPRWVKTSLQTQSEAGIQLSKFRQRPGRLVDSWWDQLRSTVNPLYLTSEARAGNHPLSRPKVFILFCETLQSFVADDRKYTSHIFQDTTMHCV